MIRLLRGLPFLCLTAAIAAAGCFTRECEPPPPLKTDDIVVSAGGKSAQPFGVDICIDATPSMEGFAAAPDSTYRTFLEDLEGSLVSGVRNVSDLRFYKFGERIREVTRAEFRNARSSGFYHEPGIFKATDIELVFRTGEEESSGPRPLLANAAGARPPAPPERRLIVVVTDLFQRDQDVNAVVKQIKGRCLSDPQCSVALMAVPSQFDGTVYDARVPSYRYQSTDDPSTFRPFYLLMFGPEDELRRFADVLSSRKYIDLGRFTVIGRRTVTEFAAEIKRDPAAKGVTPRAHCGYDAAFNIRKNFDRAAIKAMVRITPDVQAFGFNPSRVAVRGFREVDGKLIPVGDEISATSVPSGKDVEISVGIKPPRAKGDYVYVFEVVTGDVNGFVLPKWIAGLTSADPRPGRDAAKTLNLDRFVEQLITTSVLDDHHQPKLARFRVLIHKL